MAPAAREAQNLAFPAPFLICLITILKALQTALTAQNRALKINKLTGLIIYSCVCVPSAQNNTIYTRKLLNTIKTKNTCKIIKYGLSFRKKIIIINVEGVNGSLTGGLKHEVIFYRSKRATPCN